MGGLASLYESLISSELTRRRQTEEEKQKLMVDPAKMDKLVSSYTLGVSPVSVVNKKGFASETDAMDASVGSGHPMKGFAPKFRQHLQNAIAYPGNKGYSANEIAGTLMNTMLQEPDEKGSPLWSRAYGDYRLEDAEWFTKSNLKKPQLPMGYPTYEEWQGQMRSVEDEVMKDDWGFGASMATAGAIGAGAGAAIGAVFGGVTAPAGAALGAVSTMAGEAVAYPIRQWLKKTEWARAQRSHGDWIDKGQVLAAELAPDIAVGLKVESVLRKGFTVAKNAQRLAQLEPTGINFLAADDAAKRAEVIKLKPSEAKSLGLNREELKKWKEYWGRFVKSSAPEDVVEETAIQPTKNLSLLEETDHIELSTKLNNIAQLPSSYKLDNIALKEIMKSGERPEIAVTKALERQVARETALGKRNPDDTYKFLRDMGYGDTAAKSKLTGIENFTQNYMPAQKAANRGLSEQFPIEDLNKYYIKQASDKGLAKQLSGTLGSPIRDSFGPLTERGMRFAAIAARDTSDTTLRELVKTSVVAENTIEGLRRIGRNDIADKLNPYMNHVDRLTERLTAATDPGQIATIVKETDNTFAAIAFEANEMMLTAARHISPTAKVTLKGMNPIDTAKAVQVSDDLAASPMVKEVLDHIAEPAESVAKRTVTEPTMKELDDTLDEIANFHKSFVPKSSQIEPDEYPKMVEEIISSMGRKEISVPDGIEAVDDIYETVRKLNIDPAKREELLAPIKEVRKGISEHFDSLRKQVRDTPVPPGYAVNEAAERFRDIPAMLQGVKRAAGESDKAFELRKATFASDILGQRDKAFAAINENQVMSTGKKIMEAEKAGKLSAEETISALYRLEDDINLTNLGGGSKANLLGGIDGIITQLKKRSGLLSFFAVLGVGPEVFEYFSPSEAHASVGSAVLGGIGKAAKATGKATAETLEQKVIKKVHELHASRYAVPTVEDTNKFFLAPDEFQVGLRETGLGGPREILKNLSGWIKDPKDRFRYSLYDPGAIANQVLHLEKGMMHNPAVWKASYFMAEQHNTANGRKVMANIFREGGVGEMPAEVAKRFDPLIPQMEKQMQHDFWLEKAMNIQEQIKVLSKRVPDNPEAAARYAEDVAEAKKTFESTMKRVEKLNPEVQKYHQSWEQVALKAATEIPSVRVSLAIDDAAGFLKYPFLRNVRFTEKELLTIGRVKRQLNVYKMRMKEQKIPVIDGPYMHYALHPNYNVDKFVNAVDDFNAGEAFTKFYNRSKNSRMMFPDAPTSMSKYVMDTERRLQNKAFWESGWKQVKRETKHIGPIAQIFKLLDEGQRPAEHTIGNKAANVYARFEVYKRLWANPSAGLKHLVKASADVSGVGFTESWHSMPGSLRSVTWRIMDANPAVRNKLVELGIRSTRDQDKLMKNVFNSMIPVRNTHQRLLDMGMTVRDEYFTKGRDMWEKAENAGGVWINLAEIFDRGMSVTAALNIASRRGLTVEQAFYGSLDLILKNNFLSREFNPKWLHSPKIRALMLFQATPFKIMERRLVAGDRALKAFGKLGKDIAKEIKTPAGRDKILGDMRHLWRDMKMNERELKSNLFIDAMRSEQDFFGTNIVSQMAKDIAITGAATIGGAAAGMNLTHHFFHIPFLRGYTSEPGVAFSPGIMALFKGNADYENRDDADNEMLFTKIVKRWLGPRGEFPANLITSIAPDTLKKAIRLNEGDIPEIYKDSPLKYTFALPSSKEKD